VARLLLTLPELNSEQTNLKDYLTSPTASQTELLIILFLSLLQLLNLKLKIWAFQEQSISSKNSRQLLTAVAAEIRSAVSCNMD
jgi:hypothetical protein